jgi:hypothetical protein
MFLFLVGISFSSANSAHFLLPRHCRFDVYHYTFSSSFDRLPQNHLLLLKFILLAAWIFTFPSPS